MTIDLTRRFHRERDHGSALVAAVGVAMIGIALTLLVVTQAIVVTNDSARDRVRTVEIHAAEAALDATLLELETSQPCGSPALSPIDIGSGATKVTVDVVIEYFDADGPLTECTAGNVSGSPTKAVVTSTANPVNPAPGIAPVRTIEATINLKPQAEFSPGSAIFSGGGISTGAGFSVEPADSNNPAAVWVDSGNWTCNTSVKIEGDLIVPGGSVSMQNSSCEVTGNVWAKTGYSSCCVPNPTWQIGGDLTVRNGNLNLSNRSRFGGEVRIGGNINNPTANQWLQTTVRGNTCSNNVGSPCGSFPEFSPRGLPEVDWNPGDWSGFLVRSKADFGTAVKTSWAPLQTWQTTTINNNPCYIPGYMTTKAIELPSTPTIYDMRTCAFEPNNNVTLEINADTAIFARSFSSSNSLTIRSGDGEAHNVWLIVPEGGTPNNGIAETTCRTGVPGVGTYCPGGMSFSSNAINVVNPITIFLYTPGSLNFPNTSSTRGQIYAGTITVGQGNGKFQYVGIGIPGVDLSSVTSSASDFNVEIVNKREVRN